MNGKDLLEAMSLIDESYLDDAEKKRIVFPQTEKFTVWLSLAACLCAVFLGSGVWQQFAAAPVVSDEASPEFAAVSSSVISGEIRSAMAEKSAANEAAVPEPDLVTVQVLSRQDGQLTAAVVSGSLPESTQLRIPLEEDMEIPDAEYLLVRFASFDAASGILLPESITAAPDPE